MNDKQKNLQESDLIDCVVNVVSLDWKTWKDKKGSVVFEFFYCLKLNLIHIDSYDPFVPKNIYI